MRQEAGSGSFGIFNGPRLNEGNYFLAWFASLGQVHGVVWAVTGH